MSAVAHDEVPRDQHIAHGDCARAENRGVENVRRALHRQCRIVVVQDHEIGAASRRDRADRLRQRLSAAARGAQPQRRAHRQAAVVGQHVAAARVQTLRPLEHAQLLERRDHRVGIAADPEAASCREVPRPRETCRRRDRPRSSARGPPTAPLAASASISRSVMCVACTMHQRRSTPACDTSHSTGRMRVAARHSSTSRVCSAAWMWTGASAGTRRTICAQLLGRHRAQAVRRDAEHVAIGRTSAKRVDERCERRDAVNEASLSLHRRAIRRIRHVHRTPAAASGRCPCRLAAARCASRAPPDRRKACPRRRGARSGIRRRRRNPPSASRRTLARRWPRTRRDRGARAKRTSPRATTRSCRRDRRTDGRCGLQSRAGMRASERSAWPVRPVPKAVRRSHRHSASPTG